MMLRRGLQKLARRGASHCNVRGISSTTPANGRGQVYAWGKAKSGSLGLGPEVTETVGTPARVTVLADEDVVSVRAFADTSGALTAKGDLFLWGNNDGGKISADQESAKFYPFKVDGLEDVNIVDFGVGSKHGMVLDDKGRVYTWGWGGSFFAGAGALGHGNKADCTEPTLLQMFVDEGVKITQIACGGRHAVALDDEGMVWTWGQGEYGRLGHGGSSDITEPEPLEFFEEEGACSLVRSGSSYCATLTKDGKVFTWGKNNDGQLGIGNPLSMGFAMETFPREVTEGLPKDDPVVDIATGATHTLLRTAAGKALTAGMKIFNIPAALNFDDDIKIASIAAGKVSERFRRLLLRSLPVSIAGTNFIFPHITPHRTFQRRQHRKDTLTRGAKADCKGTT